MDHSGVVIYELMEMQYQSITSSSDNSSILNTRIDNMTSSSEEREKDILLFLLICMAEKDIEHHIENYLQVVDSLTDAKFKHF